MKLYEILDGEKPDKIEKNGAKTTSYCSFETVGRMIISLWIKERGNRK